MIVHINGDHPRRETPDVSPLQINWRGYVFDQDSPLYVGLVHQISGIVPDSAIRKYRTRAAVDDIHVTDQQYAGWFTNTMPQTLITNVVQYKLNVVFFSGQEKPLLLDNLRRTIVPDLRKDICFVKRIAVHTADDIRLAEDYQTVADYILFDFVDADGQAGWSNVDVTMLSAYKGNLLFLVGAQADECQQIMSSLPSHPRFAGITLHVKTESVG